jgi:uncharacterized repeat protein (TIGR02543 family)
LVVGGGGSASAGINSVYWPAGGGGGEVKTETSFSITPETPVSVSVGAGGAATAIASGATGNNGSASSFGTITSRGGLTNTNSSTSSVGAYGGASGNGNAGGLGTGSYGTGGGGGAGADGSGVNGGAGVNSDISGSTVGYGGGGAGGNGSSGTASHGGALAYYAVGATASSTGNGTANTGGGGARNTSGYGGAGGSGVVIIRYSIPVGYSVLSFDSNGGSGSKSTMILQNNTSTTVPDGTGFTNQGFEFTGWNTLANGTGTPVAASGAISISAATTLYAQWSRVPAPSCAAGVGKGGAGTSNYLTTKAGNGCVGISYKVSGVTTVATFNYLGADQSWTVPTGVTSATFYLIGAGGGGGIFAGGGGGYATGTYSSLTPGQTLTVIVGEGGGGVASATRPGVFGYPGRYTPPTYGGGGRGGSYGGATANEFASGGGRSAIRLPNATEIATAAGGGGGAYLQCGFGGGGLTGLPTTTSDNSGTGGTQTAGGTGGISNNRYPGTAGDAYQGGDSKDEGGGGGGGYFGGGGGGDNYGGGGGSSYIALLTGASTTAGANCGAAALTSGLVYVVSYNANTATSGSAPSNSTVSVGGGTLTLASNSGTLAKSNYTFAGWNTAANGSGTNYAVGATTFAPSGDTTFYAQWNSTITYDANGATGTVPTAVVSTGTASATFALNAGTGLTKTGLSFAGWNTAADGSGFNYAGGASYTSTGSTTLYAIFKPTYTYNANGATGGTVPAATVGPAVGSACATDSGFNNCRIFSYTGSDQTFTIPSDIDATKGIRVEVWGAGGGGSGTYYNDPSGAAGGYSKATLTTPTAGEVLKIVVGQGGLIQDQTVQYGGGGIGGLGGPIGASGGGYSGIFTGTTPLVISGGGGGTSPGSDANGAPSGGGGANQNGGTAGTAGAVGRGGTNTAGGAGATGNTSCPTLGSVSHNGSSLLGGASCDQANAEGGGGGGGGYFGGGGGTYQTSGGGAINGGGGGGSGYLDATRGTLITATAGENGVIGNFAYADRTSVNYASNAGRGGKAYTATVADNSGGNGLITIQWSSPTPSAAVVASNTGNLTRTGYVFAGWNTAADGTGTSVPAGSVFPATTSTTLYAAWTPSNTGLTPNFKANTTTPIGVLASTAYVINTAYAGTDNDLILADLPDKIQIIASVVSGTLAITTTTNLTLPTGYQSALNTAAASISFVGNLADVNAALATLKYTAAATAVSGNITVTAAYVGLAGTYRYNPAAPVNFSSLFPALTRTIAIGALVAPNAPTLDADSDSGTSNSDKITKINTPKINIGGLTVGATVTLTATSSSGTAVTCTFVAQTTSGSCTFSTMPDETYSIVATQTLGGTTTAGSTALANVKIDTVRPTVTLTSSNVVSGGNLTATFGIPTVSATITVTFSKSVTGLLISEITKNVESTGWAITTTSFTTAAITTINFAASNAFGTGGTAGIAKFSVAEGVATDVAGNTNTATASDFIINTLIQLTLSNEYHQSPLLNPVVGGSGGTIAQTTPGQTLTMPGQLQTSRAGHTFAGWSLSTTNGTNYGSGIVVGATYTPTVPAKLYTSWTPNVYVVTYDANGGNGAPATASQNFNYGGTALAPSARGTLVRTGYTFGGWSTAPVASGTIYSNSSDNIAGTTTAYTPAASITLYAKWTGNNYTVSFNANDGTGSITGLGITAGTAKALTSNTTQITRTGYTFAGWNTAANGSGTPYANGASVTLYGDTILYAQWTPVKAGVPTVAISGSAGNTQITVAVTAATLSTTAGPASTFTVTSSPGAFTCTITSPATTCTFTGLTNGQAYTFTAVATNTTGSSNSSVASSSATPAPYLVTYSLNSGTLTPGTANYNLGTPLTLPLPTRSGYTFGGWYGEVGLTTLIGNNGASYSPSAATTLYAKWTGVVYTITYNGNGSSGGAVPASGSYTNGGTAYPVVDNTGLLAKTGYTFAGWYTTATGTGGTAYAAASTYSSAANIILFAKWSPVARTVTYALNSDSGTTPTQLTGKYIGDTFSTSVATGFSRTGYSFTGWSDGTNIYAANSTYTVGGTDVVLTAQWAAVSYSVTFLSNGANSGVAPTQANLTSGQTFTTPANTFTKTGFNFTGWNDGTNNYLDNVTYTMTAANTVLVAQWTARGYAITYNGNTSDGGSTPTAGNYVTGSPAYSIALNTFTKTGHVFSGWKTAADGTGTAYAPGSGYSGTADLVLYAQWTPASYTITYNGNGADTGTAPTKASESWTYNATTPLTLSTQGSLTKTGYTFGGWATTANATVGVTSASPTSNTTYFAVWSATQYTVTYAPGTGASGTITSPGNKTLGQTFPLDTGSTLTPPAPSGNITYSFGYWSDGTKTYKSGATYVMPAADVVLTANWIAIYNVTYNPNGGTTSNASVQLADGNPLTIGAAASRTGYTFVKWVDQGINPGLWNPGDTTTVTATRFIFSAQWSANTNSITYNGNSNTGGSIPASGTYVTDGTPYVVVGNTGSLVRSGYTFVGWNTAADGSGTNYPAGVGATYSLPDNVILYAKWQAGTYSITYNGNGATGGATPANGTFTTGGSYSIPANSVGNLAKAGFSFAGWSTAPNGGGTSYADAATTFTTTTDVILYAKWSAASYSVTYIRNGATSAQPTQSDVQYGSTFTLAAAATQDGKNFIGWSDGTNTYGGGSTYTMGTSAITLTASWQDQIYAVTYSLNGGSGTAPVQSSLASGATFTVVTTASTKSGYTFDGWNNGTTAVTVGSTYTMTANNVTLTAVWKIAAPAAPSTVSAAGGDGSATITVAPSSSGGTPTSYVVTASPGTGSCTVISPATSCVIPGLTNGTAYTFSATATNSTGTSSSATSSAVTPAGKPDAPTGVNAVRGNTQATVSLTAVTGSATGGPAISYYTITAYDASNNAVGTPCQTVSAATSCIVTGLTNGTAYTFKATANNGLFTSPASSASNAVIPATVPNAPTGVTASVTTSGEATVSFTAPTNNGGAALTGFTITSSPGGFTCTAASNATSCVVSGLTNGTVYTFTALATNEIGNSVASSVSSSVTPQGAASAPTTISATVGDGQATVTFSGAVANGSTITGYTVKAYDNTGSEVTGVSCTVTTASTGGNCIVTGLTNGSSYTFKAITNSTANGASVTSALSIPTTAITPAKAPDAPTGVQVSAGTGKVTVSWTAPSSNGSPITSYTVTSSPGGFTCTVSAPATTCDVSTGLVAGTNYTFQVTATSVAGTSGASTASSSVAINAAPSVPLNVVATAGNASAAVSWDPPANTNGSAITGYTATAYTAGNIASGTCASTAPATTCTVTGLTNGVPYTFKVTATNGIGTSAASTASSAATPSTVPNAPTGVTAAMGDASASVSFLAPVNNGGSDVISYTVTSSPGNFSCMVNAPATSCNVTGLSNGTPYTFTVKANNKNGPSLASTASPSGTPVQSSAPTVANDAQPTGNPYVGSPLTSAVTFNGSPTPTITYQWKVCTDPVDLGTCTNISGATSASFTPTLSELGKYIVVDATANNGVGSAVTETSNPTRIINPEIAFSAPSPVPGATTGTAYVLSAAAAGGVGTFTYTVASGTLPPGVTLDPATGQIAGTPTTAGTYTFTVRATDSNGVYKDVVVTIVVAAAAAVTQPVTTPTVPTEPQPRVPTCDADCQAAKEVAATKAAADKAAADAIAKAAAEKAAADAAVAAKVASDTAATTASTKAAADAAAAAAAAKAAVDKAAAAAVAQAAADAAAKTAAAQAKAAADAQAAAVKAAADAAAALKNSTATAAAKAAAAKSANDAAAAAAAAVKAAATAAQQAAQTKATAVNATKQVEIAITSLNSKTATSQASAQANAIAAAAKAAADAAAKAAADAAAAAKANATAAQKAASDTAARIATEQKQAADAAALAKAAADAAAKATAEKVAAVAAATKAAQDLAKVLADKATLAEQAAKATDETTRAEIQKKIEEVTSKVEEVQKSVDVATTKADAAVAVQVSAVQNAEAATKEAQTQAAEAVAVKAESVAKTAEATKAVAAASVAAKVATAAKEAAAKIPSKAVITTKPSTTTSKNSATATVTGLKPGQSVKVTVNTKDK